MKNCVLNLTYCLLSVIWRLGQVNECAKMYRCTFSYSLCSVRADKLVVENDRIDPYLPAKSDNGTKSLRDQANELLCLVIILGGEGHFKGNALFW